MHDFIHGCWKAGMTVRNININDGFDRKLTFRRPWVGVEDMM